jgi:hypothetical protein
MYRHCDLRHRLQIYSNCLAVVASLAFGTTVVASLAHAFGDGIYAKVCDNQKLRPALLENPENPEKSPVLVHGRVVRLLAREAKEWDVNPDPRESGLAVITIDRVLEGAAPREVILNAAPCSFPMRVGQSGFVAGRLNPNANAGSPDKLRDLPTLLPPTDFSRMLDDSKLPR